MERLQRCPNGPIKEIPWAGLVGLGLYQCHFRNIRNLLITTMQNSTRFFKLRQRTLNKLERFLILFKISSAYWTIFRASAGHAQQLKIQIETNIGQLWKSGLFSLHEPSPTISLCQTSFLQVHMLLNHTRAFHRVSM